MPNSLISNSHSRLLVQATSVRLVAAAPFARSAPGGLYKRHPERFSVSAGNLRRVPCDHDGYNANADFCSELHPVLSPLRTAHPIMKACYVTIAAQNGQSNDHQHVLPNQKGAIIPRSPCTDGEALGTSAARDSA